MEVIIQLLHGNTPNPSVMPVMGRVVEIIFQVTNPWLLRVGILEAVQ